jgi:hypothetical protein
MMRHNIGHSNVYIFILKGKQNIYLHLPSMWKNMFTIIKETPLGWVAFIVQKKMHPVPRDEF